MEKLSKNALGGLVGGVVGAFGIVAFQKIIRGHAEGTPSELNEKARSAEESFTVSESVEPATVRAVESLCRNVLDRSATREEKHVLAPLVHFTFGGLVGLLYGVLASVSERYITRGRGTLFGAAVWFFADEAITPAFGLTRPPLEFSTQAHIFSLSGHLVYGMLLETTRRVFTENRAENIEDQMQEAA
jgi:hypothetical protein